MTRLKLLTMAAKLKTTIVFSGWMKGQCPQSPCGGSILWRLKLALAFGVRFLIRCYSTVCKRYPTTPPREYTTGISTIASVVIGCAVAAIVVGFLVTQRRTTLKMLFTSAGKLREKRGKSCCSKHAEAYWGPYIRMTQCVVDIELLDRSHTRYDVSWPFLGTTAWKSRYFRYVSMFVFYWPW